jgi:hypothetical protein
VGRIESGRVILDLRTVDPSLDEALGAAIIAALGSGAVGGGAVRP